MISRTALSRLKRLIRHVIAYHNSIQAQYDIDFTPKSSSNILLTISNRLDKIEILTDSISGVTRIYKTRGKINQRTPVYNNTPTSQKMILIFINAGYWQLCPIHLLKQNVGKI